jgi:ATP-dependent RNA helicase RhlE
LKFSALHLAKPILDSLHEEGYETPTPIQAQAIPHIIEGKDILGIAQTGTGKTAAFALPILHRLISTPVDKAHRGPAIPRVLILSPTRELASQIGDSFAAYGRHTGLTHTVIFGGVSQFHQVRALHKGVDILVATPGRLMDLMQQRLVNLSGVNIFVLDEADRMLDMGFIMPIRRIVSTLPSPRQTLFFSATMPRDIAQLADSILRNPVKVSVARVEATASLIEQSVYMVQRAQKQSLLEYLLQDGKIVRALVFTKTKHGADKVGKKLIQAGISAAIIHGNKAQNQRTRALDAFKSGKSRVLVATDVAARGLDVDNISHVFNFDLPMEAEAYVHRIGRTGRAGATGIAISFCDGEERSLLRDIERLTGKKVPVSAPIAKLPAPEPRSFSSDSHAPRREHHAPRRDHHAAPHSGHSSHPPRRAPHSSHSSTSHSDGAHHPRASHSASSHPRGDGPHSKPHGSKPSPRTAHTAKLPSLSNSHSGKPSDAGKSQGPRRGGPRKASRW